MTVAANGNLPTLELKVTLADLKQGLSEAIEKKASIETVKRMQTQLYALDVKIAQRHVGDVPQKSLLDSLKENESVSRIRRDRKGRTYIELDGRQAAAIMEQDDYQRRKVRFCRLGHAQPDG